MTKGKLALIGLFGIYAALLAGILVLIGTSYGKQLKRDADIVGLISTTDAPPTADLLYAISVRDGSATANVVCQPNTVTIVEQVPGINGILRPAGPPVCKGIQYVMIVNTKVCTERGCLEWEDLERVIALFPRRLTLSFTSTAAWPVTAR